MADVPGQLNKGDLYHYVCLMSLAVSLVFPQHLKPRPPAPPLLLSSSHQWSLPLSEGQLCITTASSSSHLYCVSASIHATIMLKNNKLINYKAASCFQKAAWWWWWIARVVSRGRSLLALTVVRVVHSWAQAFGAALDEWLSNPSVRQRFMRFAKKHC